ncbi:MAG: hypothetical protein ROM54_07355 [Anaerobiospirillum sp.]|nr:hypothetical protein [Anaerobiospirillum sp.]
MAEPVEITQKLKDLFRKRNQEVAVLEYVGTGTKGEPVYMVSAIPLEVLHDCYLGGPMFIFVDKENISNSQVMDMMSALKYYDVDPDLPYDPALGPRFKTKR